MVLDRPPRPSFWALVSAGFLVSAATVLALVALASPTDAQVWDFLTNGTTANISFTPQVDIPGANLPPLEPKPIDPETFLGNVIVGVYHYGVWLTITAAIFATMLGGLLWLLAGGNASRVDTAKRLITSSIFGLVIAFTSYLILQGINPRLLELKLPTIQSTALEGVICCKVINAQTPTYRRVPSVGANAKCDPAVYREEPEPMVMCNAGFGGCCICTSPSNQYETTGCYYWPQGREELCGVSGFPEAGNCTLNTYRGCATFGACAYKVKPTPFKDDDR